MTSPYPFTTGGLVPTDKHGIPLAALVSPLTSEIIVGSTATDAATMVTLAANTISHLTIGLSACLNTTKAAGAATATVTMVGTGSPTPPTNTVMAILALATSTTNPNSELAIVINDIWIYSGTSTVALKLNYGGASVASAMVHGVTYT